jgi:hypothetical protein
MSDLARHETRLWEIAEGLRVRFDPATTEKKAEARATFGFRPTRVRGA